MNMNVLLSITNETLLHVYTRCNLIFSKEKKKEKLVADDNNNV